MNRKPLCVLLAGLLAAPGAMAQQSDFRIFGSVGVGGLATDEDAADAAKMNEYRDLSNGLLTIFDVKGRGSQHWFDLFGENLGRDDQYVAMRGGAYDVFKYRLYTDALRHNFMFNGRTPYSGAGSSTQRATFPRLDPAAWDSLDIGYKRRDDGLMFEWQKNEPWYFRVEANQVTWSGSKPGASSQGMSPGNGFVELALPVDYTTRNAVVEGGYNTRSMHFDLSWMASKFENDNESVTWTNGYLGNGIDTTYLAADNRYQRLMGNASFRQLPWNTTLAARFTMDELKSAVNVGTSVLSGTAGQITQTQPNASVFDGKVSNETFTASANSSPAKGWDTKLYYNYRKRDDESSQITFAAPSATEREGFSYKKNNWGFDVYYRFARDNRVGGGYDYLDTEREGRHDYDRTKDKRLFVEWKNSSIEDLGARLKFTRLERESNFLHANDGTGPSDSAYLNRFVTAFDLSNVDQDQWKLTLDYTLMQHLDLGFEASSRPTSTRTTRSGASRRTAARCISTPRMHSPTACASRSSATWRKSSTTRSTASSATVRCPARTIRRPRQPPPTTTGRARSRTATTPRAWRSTGRPLKGSRSRPPPSTTRRTASWTSRCSRACRPRSCRRCPSGPGTTRGARPSR